MKAKASPTRSSPSALSFEDSAAGARWMDQVFANLDEIPDKDAEQPLSSARAAKASDKQRSSQRNVFRSHTDPDETLDLHGKTREEALMLVENYVHYGAVHGLDSLLIITGKGHRSQGGPVLRNVVEQWLRKQGRNRIQQVREAPPRWGGSGALWVSFRR